jgi:glycosyltransferase involved in cell wall biosynthesis
VVPSKPLVTAVSTFLNAETFLREAVDSVLGQTYENWELMLVDDGSSDESTAIARDYARLNPDRISYLEHPGHANRGQNASRNLGIRNGTGEYIAMLDSDDVWLPNKLEDQVALLSAEPKAAMVFGRTQVWFSWTGHPDDLGRDYLLPSYPKPNRLVSPPDLVRILLLDETPIAAGSILLRRSAYERVGGWVDEVRHMHEDYALYLKLFLEEPIFISDQCWDRYRQHPDSYTAVWFRENRPAHGPFSPRRLFSCRPDWLLLLTWYEGYLRRRGWERTDLWRLVQLRMYPERHPVRYLRSYGSRKARSALRRARRDGPRAIRARAGHLGKRS